MWEPHSPTAEPNKRLPTPPIHPAPSLVILLLKMLLLLLLLLHVVLICAMVSPALGGHFIVVVLVVTQHLLLLSFSHHSRWNEMEFVIAGTVGKMVAVVVVVRSLSYLTYSN